MQFAIIVYAFLRLCFGDVDPCVQQDPCLSPVDTVEVQIIDPVAVEQSMKGTRGEIQPHAYVTADFGDGTIAKSSEMLAEVLIDPNLTPEQRKILEVELNLLKGKELRRMRKYYTADQVRHMKAGSCRYLRNKATLFWDKSFNHLNRVMAFNGVFFILSEERGVVRTLLPVKGGYVEAYLDGALLTDRVEETHDYAVTGPCPDTLVPERCGSCWPHEHHEPLNL